MDIPLNDPCRRCGSKAGRAPELPGGMVGCARCDHPSEDWDSYKQRALSHAAALLRRRSGLPEGR